MKCRRCDRELPVGQRTTCPFCGIYLDTIITPRVKGGKIRRPNNRVLLMSLVSVGLVVGAMYVFIFLMGRANGQNALISIEESFQELYGNVGHFTEDAWNMRLASFSAAVANYERSNPRETENIERIRRYLDMLAGFDPDTGAFIGDTEQGRQNQELIRTARSQIIDLTDISLSPPDGTGSATLTILLENHSDLIISEVRMAFEAFDSHGRPSNGSNRGDNQWFLRTNTPLSPGEEESYLFQERWSDQNMSQVKLLWMEVKYGPNFSIFLPTVVCDALWN